MLDALDRELLAAIVDSSDDAIVSKTLRGIITSWNHSAERIFGYTAAEIIGQSIRILIPPERMDEEDHLLGQIAAGRHVRHFETERVRKDGSRVNVSVTLSPVRDAGGTIVGASKIVRDISDRKKLEQARADLRAVEELQRRRITEVFSQLPVAIAILRGPEHIYEFANDAYIELIGRRELLGKPVVEVLPELADQNVFELLDGAFASGETVSIRSRRLLLSRGVDEPPQEGFYDFVIQPIRDFAGRIEGIATVGFNVTELARARKAAETASQAKDEFLAMLGHELRNPLAPILTALQLMRLRGVDAAEDERAVIERQVKHLVGLVDDLLDVSRITRGRVELKKERLELADVVARAIEMASPLLEQSQHDLVVQVPRTGLVVDGDRVRLAQVFANLLTNAAKYTDYGGTITVAARTQGSHVLLSVRDTGIGIDRSMLPRIFELFTQERQALDRARGGLGLGLAIVRSLVHLHGGNVWAESAGPGRGSVFTVSLPLAAGVADVASGEADKLREVAIDANPHGPRVLVVDDNEDAAAMLSLSLRLWGFQAVTAHDAASALRIAPMLQPEVAILDLGLPVMDGYELAARLKKEPSLSATRFIALTGYGQEQDRVRSRAAGFDVHLVKPVDLDHLHTAVDGLVGNRAGPHT